MHKNDDHKHRYSGGFLNFFEHILKWNVGIREKQKCDVLGYVYLLFGANIFIENMTESKSRQYEFTYVFRLSIIKEI